MINYRFYEMLYNIESNFKLNYAHKLTEAHIHPTPFQRMKVGLAAQLFSQHTAMALKSYRDSKPHADNFKGIHFMAYVLYEVSIIISSQGLKTPSVLQSL